MYTALAIATLGLASVVNGFSTFTPSCTASDKIVNFVDSTGYRSTLDILWSALFTIIACTWTIQHLNVPEQRNGRDPGFWGDVKWALKRAGKSLKWMTITILAPELTTGIAACRLKNASIWKKKLKEMAAMDGLEYNITHAFYSDMGGFVIRVSLSAKSNLSSKSGGEIKNNVEIMAVLDAAPEALDMQSTQIVDIHLSARSLYDIREKGYIKKLPNITTEQINDRSKSDMFTKIIATIQVFSSIAQVIVRHSRRLPVSQLELAVCAFSACAVITYLLILFQPKGVNTAEVIHNDGIYLSLEEAVSICKHGDIESSSYFSGGQIDKGLGNLTDSASGILCLPYMALAGVIFGVIHCCGWFFAFPTTQELLLWRICSSVTIGVPILVYAVSFPEFKLESVQNDIVDIATVLLLLVYTIARLFIIVEVFRSLFYLPPDAFISTWTENIPQVT